MQKETICKNPGISEDARELIESGLAPRFIAYSSELYLVKDIIEAIDGNHFVFSEEDEKALRHIDAHADYFETPVESLRQFLPR